MVRAGLRLLSFVGVGGVLVAAAVPTGIRADNLTDALVSAYSSNPTLLAERAAVRATDEGVPQALSGWRPTVSVSGSAGVQQSKTDLTSEQDLNPLSGTLDVTQPLYRGGRTVSATDEAESNVLAARSRLRSVEQTVLLNAVTAYLDVLRDEARVQLNRNNEAVLQRQLEATRDRFEVGEVTRTDVAQSEARLSNAVASRVAAQGDLASSRATYQQVIGRPAADLEPAPPLPALPESLEDSLSISRDENPDVDAARFSEAAAGFGVTTAFGQLLPTVNLVGQMRRSDETTTENVASRSDSIIAQVTVPLYQSGSVTSQVRQAKQVRNQRRIEIEATLRTTLEATEQAWEALVAARSQIDSRAEQVRANEIALEGVKQEAAVGSRTVLDVLDAEQELLDARVALVVAERDEYVAGYRLISAIGRLDVVNLDLPVQAYDPTVHFDEVRDKWWGLTPPTD